MESLSPFTTRCGEAKYSLAVAALVPDLLIICFCRVARKGGVFHRALTKTARFIKLRLTVERRHTARNDVLLIFPGCSVANVTNVCGEEICTPGPVGYTCGKL